jgi:hypothetical protein
VRFEASTQARLAEVRSEVDGVLEADRAKHGAGRSGAHA